MKKFMLLLSISCFYLLPASQNNYEPSGNLFDGLRSYESGSRKDYTQMEGNGYEIIVRNTNEKLKPIRKNQNNQVIVDQYDKLARKYQGKYNEKFEIDGFHVYTDTAWTTVGDKYIRRTSYVYTSDDNRFSCITFIKTGKPDTDYQLKIARYIRSNGIPSSVMINSETSTIDFAGKEIQLSDQYRPYGIKEIRGKDYYSRVKWSEYPSLEEAENAKYNAMTELRTKFENKILDESKDSVIFLGKNTVAERVSYYGWGGKYKNPNFSDYFIVGNTQDKNIFLNVTIFENALEDRTKLPEFVSDNFFQTTKPRKLFELKEDGIPREDTIYIAKKKRGPIWPYYDENTTINGLSFGYGSFNEIKNVTTNGIRLEVPGTSVLAIFGLPYLVIPPGSANNLTFEQAIRDKDDEYNQYQLEYKNRMDVVNGLNISVAGSVGTNNRISNGIEVSGIMSFDHKVNGISIVGIARGASVANGISIAGITNANQTANGIHIAGLWQYSYDLNGISIAVVNSRAINANGLQISIYNGITNSMKGVQIGGYNQANQMTGIQIGIFNSAKQLKGIQLGLWNKNNKRSLPFINWGF